VRNQAELVTWEDVDTQLERIADTETPCQVKWPDEPERWCMGCNFAAMRDAVLGSGDGEAGQ
jgi:hypothetical protein